MTVSKKTDWKTLDFENLVTIPYSASFTSSEYKKIQNGLTPQQMEDKWFVYSEDNNLYFHRSWTGLGVYKLTFDVLEDGVVSTRTVECNKEVIKDGKAYQAELLNFLISNLLLGKTTDLPLPENMTKVSNIYQHHISGTAYKPKILSKSKPWWKLW